MERRHMGRSFLRIAEGDATESPRVPCPQSEQQIRRYHGSGFWWLHSRLFFSCLYWPACCTKSRIEFVKFSLARGHAFPCVSAIYRVGKVRCIGLTSQADPWSRMSQTLRGMVRPWRRSCLSWSTRCNAYNVAILITNPTGLSVNATQESCRI